MNINFFKSKYRDLINDADFEKLELKLSTPNIFQILGISRTEIRHSNFLSWLFNPSGSHGLGKTFLIRFLRDLSIDIGEKVDVLYIENLNFNNVELRREWKNIDLLIIFENLVICVENKFDSHDHSNQLTRYREIIGENFSKHNSIFVYLTPYGDIPVTIAEREFYIVYSYEKLIEHIEKILQIHGDLLNPSISHYIKDYLSTLKREVMQNDETNLLANTIYKNHKEIIDFIFNNKTDIISEINKIFVDKIEKRGWHIGSRNKGGTKFLTPKLNEVIPRKGHGWPLKENFLFEFDFYSIEDKGKIKFKTVIPPSQIDEIQNILRNALDNVPGNSKKVAEKWLVHFLIPFNIKVDAVRELDVKTINEKIDSEWSKIEDLVLKVESEILKYGNKLKKFRD